jgi:hypothetical protein
MIVINLILDSRMDLLEVLILSLLLVSLALIIVSTYIYQQDTDYGTYLPVSDSPYYKPPIMVPISIFVGILIILMYK